MERIDATGDERQIFLDALVSYADSCTLPKLTPSCPYYRVLDRGPTCGEECRSAVAKYGGPDRPVGEAHLGGLVLVGRQLPPRVLAGADDYDSGQLFVAERDLTPTEQSTGTVLLSLQAALRQPLIDDPSRYEHVLQLWAVLAGRGLDVESVVRGGILPDIVLSVISLAVTPALAREGALPSDMSSDFRNLLAASAGRGWPGLLDAVVNGYPTREAALADGARQPHPYLRRRANDDHDVSGPFYGEGDGSFPLTAHLAIARSRAFVGRVEDWLSRLLTEDLRSLVTADVPPKAVFDALVAGPLADDLGLWLFERMTITRAENWSTSSLLLEWRSMRGEQLPGVPSRIVAERRVDRQAITELALDRSARHTGRRSQIRDLSAAQFSRKAAGELTCGNYQAAANIFAALVDLRPGDGDAINNLAFCLVPLDREKALRRLQEATLYAIDQRGVNAANRALVLHLVGRHSEALKVALDALGAYPDVQAYLWTHAKCDEAVFRPVRASVATYLQDLVSHIERNVSAQSE